MNYNPFYVFLLLFIFVSNLEMSGQKVFTLQQCVNIAYARSLELDNASLSMTSAYLNTIQAKHARYPSLNASTSLSYNFGKTIDPTTNAFNNQSSAFQNFGLNSNVSLFQGGVLSNSIKQAEVNELASARRREALQDNIGLQVAQNYLNALLADEAIQLATYQIDLTQNQLDRLEKLIKAGSLPANDRLEIEAQIFRDEQQIITAANNYEIAILNLKNLLRIEIEEEIELVKVDPNLIPFDESTLNTKLNDVYKEALAYQPSIKADQLDFKSVLLGKKISEGRLYPSLVVGGSLATNYSDLAKRVSGQTDVVNNQEVIIAGTPVTVGFPSTIFSFEDTPYASQLDNNLSYGFGLTLNIPIYNNKVSRLNVERSDINIKQVANQNEINKQNLKTTIQSAITQARAAKQSYLAAEKSVIAQQASLDNLEKKLEAGTANNFDFINAKHNLSIAKNSLSQSKYDYLFKLKVIDYYLGKPLKL